jgi:TolB protein
MNMRNKLALFFAILCAASLRAEPPTITISKTELINISVSPISGAEGAQVTKTLQNDLRISGYFAITPAGSAAFIASGSASGGNLAGKVADHSGGTALARSYNGPARAQAHAFANDIIETLTGNRGFAGSKIAFVANKSGRKEIYVADCDGSGLTQLTRDGSISVAPRLSADARRLLYTGYKSGYADIYEVDLGSGSRNRIIKYPGTNTGAVFSPDGRRIAVCLSKDGNPELYVCDAGGGGAHRLTHSSGAESSPTWSPGGDEIIYSSDDRGSPQLYRIGVGGGSPRALPTGQSYATEPNWSPDGKKVAFNVRQGGSFAVAVLDLAGGGARVLGAGENPVWGPDSRHILFAEGGGLYILDAQTGRKNKVVDGLGAISEPTWSR